MILNKIYIGIPIALVNKYVFSLLLYYNIQGYLAGGPITINFWLSLVVLFFTFFFIFVCLDFFFKDNFFFNYISSTILCLSVFYVFFDISSLPAWKHLRTQLFGLTYNNYFIALWYLLPFIFFSLFNFLLRNNIKKINKFFTILSLFFFIIFLLRVNFYQQPNPPKTFDNTINEKNFLDKRVIWVLFDEFDHNLVYKNKKLKNIFQFNENSFVAKNMQATSDQTISAIPEILTGIVTKEIKVGKDYGNLKIVDTSNKFHRFNFENSIFGKVQSLGYASSIFGIYHPYCYIFSQAKYCSPVEYHHDQIKWYDGIKHVLFLKLIDKFFKNKLNLNSDYTKKQIDLIDTHLNHEAGLVFMHLGIPHLPSLYAEKLFNKKVNNDIESYNLNLKLTDLIIGSIIKKIEKERKLQLIIFSSDHWFRESKKARPVVFSAKIYGDNNRVIFNDKSSNYHIGELVEEFFKDNIKSNSDINKFFLKKKTANTRLQKRYSIKK